MESTRNTVTRYRLTGIGDQFCRCSCPTPAHIVTTNCYLCALNPSPPSEKVTDKSAGSAFVLNIIRSR